MALGTGRRLAASLVAALAIASPAGARSLDVVYVEADVGGSSGGHLAARFDERVYHFQNRGGRWLRMERVGWEWFQYTYGVLQNRDLRLYRVEMDEPHFLELRGGFNDRFLGERRHFDTLAALDADVALVDQSRETASGRGRWSVRGAGFFCPRVAPEVGSDWRTRVATQSGRPALARRTEAVEAAMQELELRPVEGTGAALRRARGLAVATPSERYGELVQQRLALALLADPGAALCPAAFRVEPAAAGRLDADDRVWIEATGRALEERARALLSSRRPDWGDPLLLVLARREALAESLRRGRWVVLDAYPRDAPSVPGSAFRDGARRRFLEEIQTDVADQLARARAALRAASDYDERRFNDWEDALNRALELRRGIRDGRDVRVSGERLVPEGWGEAGELPLPSAASAGVSDAARQARTDYRAALETRYDYDLVHHNCATELLRSLDGGDAVTRLGGRVDPDRGFHFVPRAAFRAAGERFGGARYEELPSYRARQLARMRRDEGALRVFARESNTLSSTVYRRNSRDSWFLFFTDDAPLTRPVFGLVNLVVGAGETGAGLLSAPFDSGARLRSGLSGMLFSAPELVFVNVRKGTLEYGRGASAATPAPPSS